ncbi:methyltransferase domain-containing protein [Kribbella jejuensis]|uniref:23S rRNA m(1)G-748 methyltransferase n=1 Tax=Kribbella jejuensis TaxID=236068 RepID=A0A542D9K4_9ACTN|nr:methyltransferase domain-containing protein [Kribbella jejuensis]TQI99755.1 23S rRNA m(1)G-748 methyltransferase [Kribbella jejuensis]
MKPDLVTVLRCPACADRLALDGRTARCAQGHAYDLAKQGYLNLMPAASNGIEGDSAAMVGARTVFLGTGHYAAIRDALILEAELGAGPGTEPGTETATETGTQLEAGLGVDDLVVEVGAGTGYYLAGVLGASEHRRGIALDVSKYAARRAAKLDPRIASVVCDAWRELPIIDDSAQVLLNVFAPRNAKEMARILAPGGRLLVVTPNQQHLAELVDVLGMVSVDEEKERRLQDSLSGEFERTGGEVIEETMTLDRTAVEQLVLMTPSARHLDYRELLQQIAALPEPSVVTLSVTLSTWQAR